MSRVEIWRLPPQISFSVDRRLHKVSTVLEHDSRLLVLSVGIVILGTGRGQVRLASLAFALEAGAVGIVGALYGSEAVHGGPVRGRATPVLVVDDDPNARGQARSALAGAGYAPAVTAEPGKIARLVETRRPCSSCST